MDAVGAVDIGATGRAEHDGVALGLPAKTVCRGIGLMIGLDLDDDAARALEQQRYADQIGGDGMDAAGEKPPAKQESLRHPRKSRSRMVGAPSTK